MSDDDTELRRQIQGLSERMARVEQRLGLAPVISQAAPPLRPPVRPAGGMQGLITRARESRWGASPEPDYSDYGEQPSRAPQPAVAPPTSPVPTVTESAPPTVRPVPPKPAATPRQADHRPIPVASNSIATIERLIGGRWYAVLGAIIVVIGVGLFFKLALQQGWVVLTPAARCIAGAVFGALLLIGGEIARRRINDNAGAGLSAAGIGVAYASVYAAYGFYQGLLGQAPAFILLAFVAALGIAIGARARQVSVAIVSLLCGYLTPILLSEGRSSALVFASYTFMLLVAGLFLSAWRGGRFVAVRSLVWWATLILGGFWSLRFGTRDPEIALAFLAACWGAVHAELAISSGRFGLVPGTGGNIAPSESQDEEEPVPRRGLGAWRPLSSSFSTTAWAGLLATLVLRSWMPDMDWLATAGLAVASGMGAMVLAGHLRILRDRPQTDAQRLGACLMVQAGALVIAATALAIQGPAQAVFWLAMGIAVTVGGSWIGSRGIDIYGLIVLCLATGRTLLWESWSGTMPRSGVPSLGLYLTYWAALMGAVGAGWIVVGFLFRRGAREGTASILAGNTAVAIGMTLLCVALQHSKATVLAPLVTVASLGLALSLVGYFLRAHGLKTYAMLVLATASAYALTQRWWLVHVAGDGVEILGLHLTAWSLALVYLGAVWMLAAKVLLSSAAPASRSLAVICAGMGVAALMGSLVHASAGPSLIVAWALFAVAAGAARYKVVDLFLDRWGVAAVAGAMAAWIVYYPPLGGGWSSDVAAGMHPGLWTGLLIGGCFGLFALRLLAAGPSGNTRAVLAGASYVAMTAMIFAATSLEVGRSAALLANDRTVQRAAVSVWWGIFAFGLIALGFVLQSRSRASDGVPRGIAICRQVGLALLGIAALKALIVDLGGVSPLGRVISIVGVGLLMLAVSVIYAKVSSRLAELRVKEPLELPQ